MIFFYKFTARTRSREIMSDYVWMEEIIELW